MERGKGAFLPNMDTQIQLGDKLVLVGNQSALEEAAEAMGRKLDTELTYDRTIYDVRRFFVTNASISGQKIASLNLPEKFSVIITRVQRGDMDMIATGDTVLELGDRVVLVTRRQDIKKLSDFFGNSYEALSHINLLSFGSGMALGLLLGMVTFTLPGDFNFKLGFAGGPIIVALILGALRRTGPIVWTLPYSANLTLRQIGLILMLAGIGIRSGHTFLQTILEGGGGMLFLSGAIIAITTALLSFFVGYKLLKIPFSLLSGMVSIQPAVLDYALDQTKNKLPTIGFTLILPVALIAKIIIVQILFVILNG
jgi:putative transport protein